MVVGGDLEALEYRAIHPYHSGTEGDLVFSEGDTVLVYWGQDNGWWYGAFGGIQGWFPESYVEVSVPGWREPLVRMCRGHSEDTSE